MDGPGINEKIRFGYAKSASKLGQDFQLYRSAVPIDPIDPDNLVGTIKAVMTTSWDWMRANKYGNAVWYAVIDGQEASEPLSAQVGDYLTGDKTFFIASKQYQMPMQSVECNRTISIIRPTQDITPGPKGYVGYLPEDSEVIMTNMPASVLTKSSREKASSDLPTDTKQPAWTVLIPNLANVPILVGDIISDEQQENYAVMDNELTDLGWRLTAQQVVNAG